MHALLIGALYWGVQWQRRPPEPVSVELVRALPAPAAVQPEPVREAPPPKPVEIKQPEPPPKPVAKPDIALKEPEKKKPEKKEEPKPEPPKPEKKPEPKPQPEKKAETPAPKSLMERELEKIQAAKTQNQQAQDADRARKLLDAAATTASLGRISADWGARISQKVKSNFIRPPGLAGDPQLVFKIQLLPSGEILGEPQLISNTGNANLEEAVRRAILKSSPLPKPEKNEAFQREIVFTFYPTRDTQ